MTRFSTLYFCCLLFCFGGLELAHFAYGVKQVDEPLISSRVMAIPPKPKGVEESQVSGDGEFRYSEAVCAEQKAEYRDVCYHTLARQRSETDLQGALMACDMIDDPTTLDECQSDVAEGYAAFDRTAALAVCPTIKKRKWRDQCVFGIAYSYAVKDPNWAFRKCDDSGRWRDFCRHDVIGEIAVVDMMGALDKCAEEEGDILTRKTCWHGIGKYLARKDVDRAFEACALTPPGPSNLYIENCIHGLGWGGSEKNGEEFIPTCDRAGPQKDSCLLGIAYNLRRIDAARGLEVCRLVERTDLKSQCNRFVGSKR